MKCPKCLENFVPAKEHINLFDGKRDVDSISFIIETTICPNGDCKCFIIYLKRHAIVGSSLPGGSFVKTFEKLIQPASVSRQNIIESDIPSKFLEDYREACKVLSDSPKASAALSRRVLQSLLVDKAGAKKKKLYDQIGEVIDSKELPSRVNSMLDIVRVVGNFAAHPIKSNKSNEIIDVEPGEAEANLEAVEALFDFYFTQERIADERKRKIDKKLTEAGKPSLEEAIGRRKKSG